MLLINKSVQLIFLNKVDKVVHFRSQNMCKFIRFHCLLNRKREGGGGGGEILGYLGEKKWSLITHHSNIITYHSITHFLIT